MAETPMHTGEVIVELEKGLRIFKALEKAHEITMALATTEQRGIEAERRLTATNQSIAEAEAQGAVRMEAAHAQAQAVEDAADRATAKAQQDIAQRLEDAQRTAVSLVEGAQAEQTRIDGLIHEATLQLMGLRQAVDGLAVERTTLETQVQAARDAKDALLRA